MLEFPKHFPADCPPKAAEDAGGQIFRFVKNKPPVAQDFETVYEKEKTSSEKEGNTSDTTLLCQKCGISVMVKEEDAKHAVDACPWFRKRKLAKARVNAEWGKIMKTNSIHIRNHHTWWVPTGKSPEKIFDVIELK